MVAPRTALIAGGGGGIGMTIVDRLSAGGVRVVIADLDGDAAEEAAARLRSSGRDVAALSADVTDESSVSRLFEALDESHGRLDMLVNCAGVSLRVNGERPFVEETPLDVWEKTMAINLTGTFLICRGAVPRMKPNGWGRIVNLASMAGRTVGEVTSSYYAASKAGVLGFSRVLATELGQYGITVNCVAPSRVATALSQNLADSARIDRRYIDKTPVGRIGRPEDVAAAVSYFLSDEAGFVTGAILDVTGGYFMP